MVKHFNLYKFSDPLHIRIQLINISYQVAHVAVSKHSARSSTLQWLPPSPSLLVIFCTQFLAASGLV